ncbi:MAG TPA: MFS transporter [Xanthobacteraceae bacterium]|nr:MFS transporter [Xanthobacteraceae bacterium]
MRTASLAANIGTWMYTAASSWLMTSLNPHPLIVSLVQVASSLPIFPRRCLSLGRVRGCGRPRTLRRDVFGG